MAQLPTNNLNSDYFGNKESIMPKIAHSLEIQYHCSSPIWEFQDPEKYIATIQIKVIGISETSQRPEVLIGEGVATRVAVGRAINARESLFYIFDQDQELVDAGCAVYTSDFRSYRPSVKEQFQDRFFGEDFLLIEKLQLLPKFRGQKIGLAAMQQIVCDLGAGCSLAVVNPAPLPSLSNRRLGRLKLRKYWETLGFRRLGKTRFWAIDPDDLPVSSELELPTSISIDETTTQKFEGPNG